MGTLNQSEINSVHEKNRKAKDVYLDKIRGSLFGGAIGDALGAPVEFMDERDILLEYGLDGITEYELDKATGKALFTDDTQMTLFTANGMLVGETRLCIRGIGGVPRNYIIDSYSDWLRTQEISFEQMQQVRATGLYNNAPYRCTSWLCDLPGLYSRRAPGRSCITAIQTREESHGPDEKYCKSYLDMPINNSKGCGGIMRVAPLALHYEHAGALEIAMEAAEVSAITHGHSLGYMSSAVLDYIISRIVYPHGNVKTLKEIVLEARDSIHEKFKDDRHIRELDKIITLAVELSENKKPDIKNIHKLGEGWVAEETLAIAIYCSLKYQNDFSKAVITAVNHKGDSDSTGAVTGNIVGALVGYNAIEDKWKKNLEYADVIEEMAQDICYGCQLSAYSDYRDEAWESKYCNMKWYGRK